MKPLISIVMAVYNGEAYLEPQIKSILDQTYDNLELILSDDGSTDRSMEIAERLASQDSRIKIHRNSRNFGLVRNFRQALRLAQGDLICFADQDDVWRADKLQTLVSLIVKDPRNMLAYSDLEICDSNLNRMSRSFWKAARIRPRSGALRELPLLRNIMPGCSMMFRKEILAVLTALPEDCSFMHDHLAFIVAAAFGRVVFSRETLVQYRQHAQNNIGAFYPSVTDRDRFQTQLAREIKLLRAWLPVDLANLERFLDERARKNILSRLKFVRYHLFLRPDTLFEKLLGIFECLTPELYQRLRRGLRAA